jgi:hypothetical protein
MVHAIVDAGLALVLFGLSYRWDSIVLTNYRRIASPLSVTLACGTNVNISSRKGWSLSSCVIRRLEYIVEDSPVNPKTGRRQLTVTVCSATHLEIVRNLLCTADSVGTDPHLMLIAAIDSVSYNMLSGFHSSTVLVDLSPLKPVYYDFRRVNLVLAEALLLLGVEVTLLDGDTLVLENPATSLSNAILDVDIVMSTDRAMARPATELINVGILSVAPTLVGIGLVREWMRVFALRKGPRLPQFQRALKDIFGRGRSPLISNFSTKDWQFSAKPAIGLQGVIRARLMSLFEWCIARWITPTFAAGAVAANVPGPTFIHLAWLVPLEKKMKWLQSTGLGYATEIGCRPRKNRIFFDLGFEKLVPPDRTSVKWRGPRLH